MQQNDSSLVNGYVGTLSAPFSTADTAGGSAYIDISKDGKYALSASYGGSLLSILPIADDGTLQRGRCCHYAKHSYSALFCMRNSVGCQSMIVENDSTALVVDKARSARPPTSGTWRRRSTRPWPTARKPATPTRRDKSKRLPSVFSSQL